MVVAAVLTFQDILQFIFNASYLASIYVGRRERGDEERKDVEIDRWIDRRIYIYSLCRPNWRVIKKNKFRDRKMLYLYNTFF